MPTPYNGAMRTWRLAAEDACTLVLAADARFGGTDYIEDQIWQVLPRGEDPQALTVRTSYGRQAQGMRIFPSFVLGDRLSIDPAAFHQPVVICQALPNYVRLEFWPLPELEATAEYWVADSRRLVSRIRLTNRVERVIHPQLRLHALLAPDRQIDPMRLVTWEGVTTLQGRVVEIRPLVFLSGGAVAFRSIYPSLQVTASLAPGETRAWTWAHAGLADAAQSFEAARAVAAMPFEAMVARIERMAEGIVQVESGHPAWDAVLHFSQVAALSSFVGPTRHLPAAAPILIRSPEHGHSQRGDGTDYDWCWSGQESLAAFYLARQVLPAAPELAKGVVLNALATQGADGAVDAKPGLAGQRQRMSSVPILCELSWQIFRQTEDRTFLLDVLPKLREAFDSWFEPARDRDRDGFPEWEHAIQPGYDDHPVFSQTRASAQGADIRCVESPDLAAFLLREAEALSSMAQAAGEAGWLPGIHARVAGLLAGLARCWDPEEGAYRRIDRDLHTTPSGAAIVRARRDGRYDTKATLQPPARLVIRVSGPESEARSLEIVLSGSPPAGRVRTVRLDASDFAWYWNLGSSTTDEVFARLERVQVRGLGDAFETLVRIPDLTRQDLGTLLPLWPQQTPSEPSSRLIDGLVSNANQFWQPHGLPLLPASDPGYAEQIEDWVGGVSMPWNVMIGEGLIAHGRQELAAALFDHLMAGVTRVLREEHTFRQAYHPETGQGLGEWHHACGVAPLSLFLGSVGVQLISPTRVGLRGRNPFPFPVTITWRGLAVTRSGEVSRVVFPDGQALDIQGEEPLVIEQEPRRPNPRGAGK